MYIFKYYSSSWSVFSVYLSVYKWKAIDSFISISNILFNSLINLTANYSLLSEVTLSGNPCNFHILSLNNLTNFSAIIFSIVIIKYNILKNLSHTTKIELWSLDTGNFIIKFTNIYIAIVSLVLCLVLVFLLVSSSYFLFSDTDYIFPLCIALPS